ncbi:MAG: GNAT family N-acetyltransferase [Dehalococcoidia bacterium]
MTTAAASPIAPVTLEGEHVRLVPLAMEHLGALLEAASQDRSNYQWTWVPDSREAMQRYLAEALDLASRKAAVPFATVLKETGRVIGTTRFANFEYFGWPASNPHFKGEAVPDGVEIGWTWLATSAQRTRANTEAKWMMLRHAFDTWGVRVVRLNTDRRNERSRAAIERIGGRLDGVIRANRMGSDGNVRDSACYSIIESEWPAADAALRARLARA